MSRIHHKELALVADCIAAAADFIFQAAVVWVCVQAELELIRNGIPEGTDPMLVGRVMGHLENMVLVIFAWRFQSTRSSKRKDELIANSVPAAPPAQPPTGGAP